MFFFEVINLLTHLDAFIEEEASWSRDFSTVNLVKTIHINSAILAIKSPYFYKVKVVNLSYAVLYLSFLVTSAFVLLNCSYSQMEWENQNELQNCGFMPLVKMPACISLLAAIILEVIYHFMVPETCFNFKVPCNLDTLLLSVPDLDVYIGNYEGLEKR